MRFWPWLEIYRRVTILGGMKTTLLFLVGALLVLTSCRNGRGGPVERAGRSVDNAVDWAGYGVRRAGEGIQRAAR